MRRWCWLLGFLCGACGFGHDVEQDGSYAIVPSTRVADSAFYALDQLLKIEQDLRLGQTRLYFFRGELHAADLGLEDLRRIGLRHGGFQMAFDPPREAIDIADIEHHGRSLTAHAGDEEIELVKLDDDGLRETGAQRYLTSVKSSDYAVAAYFGVIPSADALGEISIDGTKIKYQPELPDPELAVETEDDRLSLDYRVDADFLVVEMTQLIESNEDEREIDALVRTSLAPGSPYVVTPALLTDVASQGCWSSEEPLDLRFHQVVRTYTAGSRSWSVAHERIDTQEIASETWSSLLEEDSKLPAYCSEFE